MFKKRAQHTPPAEKFDVKRREDPPAEKMCSRGGKIDHSTHHQLRRCGHEEDTVHISRWSDKDTVMIK